MTAQLEADEMVVETAYTEFYRAHHGRLHRFCARRWHEALIDDIVAETFTIAWRRFDDISERAGYGWLCGVAVNVARNSYRAERRRATPTEAAVLATALPPV